MSEAKQPSNPIEDKGKEIREWIIAIVAGVVLAMFVRTFIFTFARVDGTSMVPTLEDNNRVFVNIIGEHFTNYEPGDIIVFHYNSSDDYVKRIIAVGGDKVKIENSTVYVNGKAIDESYIPADTIYADYAEIQVPNREYFVLGDNRQVSHDSRYSDVGTISKEQILGKVEFAIFPYKSL